MLLWRSVLTVHMSGYVHCCKYVYCNWHNCVLISRKMVEYCTIYEVSRALSIIFRVRTVLGSLNSCNRKIKSMHDVKQYYSLLLASSDASIIRSVIRKTILAVFFAFQYQNHDGKSSRYRYMPSLALVHRMVFCNAQNCILLSALQYFIYCSCKCAVSYCCNTIGTIKKP